MKTKKFAKTIGHVANELVINGTAVAAGTATATYCINHDVCNDQDTSIIVGAVGGASVGVLTEAVLRGAENMVISMFHKIRNK